MAAKKISKEVIFVLCFTPIILGVLGFVFYSISSEEKENKKKEIAEISNNSLLDQLNSEQDPMNDALSIDNRAEVYSKDQEKYSMSGEYKSESDLWSSLYGEGEEEEEEVIEEEVVAEAPRNEKVKVVYRTVNAPSSKPKVAEKPKEEPRRRRQQDGFNTSASFSSVAGSNDRKHKQASSALDKDFTTAVIDHEIKVKSGNTVRIQLTEPLNINGQEIPKGTVISGRAQVGGERVTINVSSIRFKGKQITTNIAVYDIDAIAGIYIPGGVNQEIGQDAVDQTIAEAGSHINVPIVGSFSTNSLKKKNNDPFAILPTGYEILLRFEK